jgi:hypothetical protein
LYPANLERPLWVRSGHSAYVRFAPKAGVGSPTSATV